MTEMCEYSVSLLDSQPIAGSILLHREGRIWPMMWTEEPVEQDITISSFVS